MILYDFINERFILPFGLQDQVSQRATNIEFIIVRLLKYLYNNLDNSMNKVFLNDRVFKITRNIRFLREAKDGLSDLVYDYTSTPEGVWISSSSREKVYDIILLYIPGGFVIANDIVEVYLEYLSIFIVQLQLQGFQNPAFFIPKLSINKNLNDIINQSVKFIFNKKSDFTQYILVGDSIGCGLIGNYLNSYSHLSQNFSALLLISPMMQSQFENTNSATTNDYINLNEIGRWADMNDFKINFQISNILPHDCIIVSYGNEEALAPYIKKFIESVKKIGCQLKVDVGDSQLHNWGLINFYSESLIDHREESIHRYTNALARLILHNNPHYYNISNRIPAQFVTLDEERML